MADLDQLRAALRTDCRLVIELAILSLVDSFEDLDAFTELEARIAALLTEGDRVKITRLMQRF